MQNKFDRKFGFRGKPGVKAKSFQINVSCQQNEKSKISQENLQNWPNLPNFWTKCFQMHAKSTWVPSLHVNYLLDGRNSLRILFSSWCIKKKPSLALRAIRSENFAGVLRSQVNSEGQLWGANFALTGGGGPKLPGWAKAPSAHAMHCLSLAHLQHHLAP